MACENKLVTQVAQNAQSAMPAGFDISVLIELGVQIAIYLIKCYRENHPATPPQQVVAAHYADGEYSRRFLANMQRRVHMAARMKGQKLSNDQARALAIASLDAIRTGTDAEVQEAIENVGKD